MKPIEVFVHPNPATRLRRADEPKPRRKLSRVVFSHQVNTWGTPLKFFQSVDRLIKFTLDACALPDTAKCRRYVHPNADGLNRPWNGERVWNNPPYDSCDQWMPKARDEALNSRSLSANLVPKRGDTEWWGKGVLCDDGAAGKLRLSYYDETNRVWWYVRKDLITGVHEVKGRITFDGETASGEENNAPFPSALVFHATPGLKPRLRQGITTMWPWV